MKLKDYAKVVKGFEGCSVVVTVKQANGFVRELLSSDCKDLIEQYGNCEVTAINPVNEEDEDICHSIEILEHDICLSFGEALEHIKQRHNRKIARMGWNGKGQYVTVIPAGNARFQGYDMQDCLALKNAQGNMQPGWLPSQGDLLAMDWVIVE